MTPETAEQTLGETEFYDYLSRHLEWDGDLSRDSYLLEDLGLDSLRMLEVLLLVEDLGVDLTDDEVPTWNTFGDVYVSYRSATSSRSDGHSSG